MPIKPENKHLYPADWPEIRERILVRAGDRCEFEGCTAKQYDVGAWQQTATGLWVWARVQGGFGSYSAARVAAGELFFASGEEGRKPTVIVLTIAHLDHDPTNCDQGNLRAACQRHHLAHDIEHHRANAYATRMAKRGNMELPL